MEWMTIEEREHECTGNYQDYMSYVKNVDRASLFFNDHPYAMSMVANEERKDLSSRDISDFNDLLNIEDAKESSSRDQQYYKSEEGECLINRSPPDYLNWHNNEDRVVLSVIDHQYAKGMENTADRQHMTASPFSCSEEWVNSDRWEDALSKDHWDMFETDDHLSLGHYDDYMYCFKMMKNCDNLPTNDHLYAKYQVNGEEREVLPAWPISCPKEQITNGEFGKLMSIEPHNSMDWLNTEEGGDLFTWNSQDYMNLVRFEDGDQFPVNNRQHILEPTIETKKEVSLDGDMSFCKRPIVGEGGLALPKDYWNSLPSLEIETGNGEPVIDSKDYLNWGKIEAGEAQCTDNKQDSIDIVKNEEIKGMSAREVSCTKIGVKIEAGNGKPVCNSKDCLDREHVEAPSINNQDSIDKVKKNVKVMSAREISCTKNGVKLEEGNRDPAQNSKDYLNLGHILDGEVPSTNHQDSIGKVKKGNIKGISAVEVSSTKNGVKTKADDSESVGNSKYYLSWVEMEKGEVSWTNNHPKTINKVKREKMEGLSTRVVLYIENGVIMERKHSEPARNSKDYLNRGKKENRVAPFNNKHRDSLEELKREKKKHLPAGKVLCTTGGAQIETVNSAHVKKSKDFLNCVKMVGEATSTSNHQDSSHKIKREQTEDLPTRKVVCTNNVKTEKVKEDLHRDNLVSNKWIKMEECGSSLSVNYMNNASRAKNRVGCFSTDNSPHIIGLVNGVERKHLSARDISCSKDQLEVEGTEALRNSQISSLWIKLEEVERASSSSWHNYTNWVQINEGGKLSFNTCKDDVNWRKTEVRDDLSLGDNSCGMDGNIHAECKETDCNLLKSMGILKFKKEEKLLRAHQIDSVNVVKGEEIEKMSGFEQQSVDSASSENQEEDPPDQCHLDSGDEETGLNYTAEDTAITNPARKLHWNPPEVVALLDAVGTSRYLQVLLSSERLRNTDAFTEISITLQKAGHSRTPAQCRNKMKTLRRLFHTKWITASCKSGEAGTPFWVEHFSRVWALAGKPKYSFFKPHLSNSV